jgi:Right handed beta helix region
MTDASLLALAVTILAGLALPLADAGAATIEIFPSNAGTSCNEEFVNRANALKPGDVLILHGGTYTQTCRRGISVNGTAANPITIRAADGEIPILTRPQAANFNYNENNFEIDNSSYLIIRGLRFKGGDGGVSFNSGHHITFENNEVYETGNNALRMNGGNTDSFIIRGNHLHHTGLLASSVGTTEGEGMYVGCNDAACIASNHLIEGNYIHHTRGTGAGGNDGIEVSTGPTATSSATTSSMTRTSACGIRASSSTAGTAEPRTSSKATSCGTAARPSRWSPTRSSGTT